MTTQHLRFRYWHLVVVLLLLAAGIPAVAMAYDYQPDEYGAACFVDGGAWDPSGGYIQDIAKATLGTNESCACRGTPGCTWDPNPTNNSIDFTNAGKPFYQMILDCNEPFEAYSMAWTLANIDWEPPEGRVEWCTEAVSYWHKHAHIPYETGYGTNPADWAWLVISASNLVDWYRLQETLSDGRGRFIEHGELSYEDIELGVNVPVPGAYVPIRGYDAGTRSWKAWRTTGHSLIVDEMWIYQDALGSVCRIEVTLLEGNSDNRVRNDRDPWTDIIDLTPEGSSFIGSSNRKIFGFGIDLDADGKPIYDPARLHYVKNTSIICTPLFPAVVTIDPSWNEGRFKRLVAYAKVMDEYGGPGITATSIKTGGRLPDGCTTQWYFPAGLKEEVITIDLRDAYPLPIQAIEFRWDDGKDFFVPEKVNYSVQFAREDGKYYDAKMPEVTIPTDKVNPPIPTTLYPEGAVKEVRYIRLVFPEGTFPKPAALDLLRFWVASGYPEDAEDPPIIVTTPNGGETWTQGSSQTIRWNYSGYPGPTVKIEALLGSTVIGTIPAVSIGSNNTGEYLLKVPYNTPPGNKYRIRVTSTDTPAVTDTSDDNFTISSALTLKHPNGGEVWQQGTTHSINWTYFGTPGTTVIIEALKGPMVVGTLPGIPIGFGGEGSYTLKIPCCTPPGTDYRFRITSSGYPGCTDTSDGNFTISSGIRVAEPNGGEKWLIGSPQTVRWYYTDECGPAVKIEALRGTKVIATIPSVPIGSGGKGSFNLTVPSTTPLGTDYWFRVTSTSCASSSDMSDGPFAIVAPV